MGKTIVNMTNWELFVKNNRYNLSGFADKHPTLGENAYVAHTSSLEGYHLMDDILAYETQNTIYLCPLKYVRVNPYNYVDQAYKEELVHLADESENVLDQIVAALAKISIGVEEEDEFAKHIQMLCEIGQKEIQAAVRAENERLCEIAKTYEDAIYIELHNVKIGDMLAYHIGECSGVLRPRFEVGTTQNRVFYTKQIGEQENNCNLEFRYYVYGSNRFETYGWSDNIKQAVIKNRKSDNIIFNGEVIMPEETKIFTTVTLSEKIFF